MDVAPARPFRWLAALVGLAAALIHFGYLADARDDPTYATPLVDAAEYADLARRIAENGLASVAPFFRPPLYPAFIAIVFKLAGERIVAVKIAQAIVGALTSVATCLLGARAFSSPVGLLAGLVLALYGPFLFFNAQLFPVSLATFLNTMALILVLRAQEPRAAATGFFSGSPRAYLPLPSPTPWCSSPFQPLPTTAPGSATA